MKHFNSIIFVLVIMAPGHSQESLEGLYEQAIEESLSPVRPGIPGHQPFWNHYAMRFIYAPAFDFKEVQHAVSYQFTAISFFSRNTYSFMADFPWLTLTPIWGSLPVGEVFLKVEGIDSDGKIIGLSGERKFYRAAPFHGPYHSSETPYFMAGERQLDYIFHLDHVQQWLRNNSPDPAYILNAYPGKIIASTITAMLKYAGLNAEQSPEIADRALMIASNAADYLIEQSEPQNAPLAFLPPTYAGDQVAAAGNEGKIMINVCASVGQSYLELYDVTRKEKYLLAAVKIAETLINVQLPTGVWPIKMQTETGQEDTPNYGIPIDIIHFFDKLIEEHDKPEYRSTRDMAWQWILENSLKTYHWEGQFEDVSPSEDAYRLMGMPDACRVAGYLLNHNNENPGYLEKGLELIRFVEDQFVVWEKPLPYGQQGEATSTWFTPSVLEQYICYTPIDACLSMVSALFFEAYQATQDALYLEKSRELANSLKQKQGKDGNIPTGWDTVPPTRIRYWWLNCATLDAVFLTGYNP